MSRADQQRVLDLLKGFNRLSSLKSLFWTELNYDRANEPRSRRSWPQARANMLADDPVLFATGAAPSPPLPPRSAASRSEQLL